jgi:hypothetical protein
MTERVDYDEFGLFHENARRPCGAPSPTWARGGG